MALLLIGSTGNGKSTFGNFLLDSVQLQESDSAEQTFKTATCNLPETRHVTKCSRVVNYSECQKLDLTVIDTPGLSEMGMEQMLQIAEELQVIDLVRACVIVVKFENKIDTQYKQTLKHYRDLFPSLFERNIVVVMTGYAADEKSKKRRKQQGIDEYQVVANVKKEIMENGRMSYDPRIFLIDCVPIDKEELETAVENRDTILEYIACLLYTSPSPRDATLSRMPSSA